MKKTKTLTGIALFIAVLVLVAHFIPIRPVVVIINNTKETIFVYAGESIYNVEPEPVEVARIVRSKPEIIAPGKSVKIKASFTSLIRKDAALDIGWSLVVNTNITLQVAVVKILFFLQKRACATHRFI